MLAKAFLNSQLYKSDDYTQILKKIKKKYRPRVGVTNESGKNNKIAT